jgi:single-strand DNA-binding protein
MYNKAFLIGNLTRDPELRYTPSGIPVVRFTVAVNRPKGKNAKDVEEGSEKQSQNVDFIPVVAWRRLAEICGEYLKKGRPVSIEGRLQIRSYEKNGVKRTVAEVLADGMQMLGKRPDGAPASGGSTQAPEPDKGTEEVPF